MFATLVALRDRMITTPACLSLAVAVLAALALPSLAAPTASAATQTTTTQTTSDRILVEGVGMGATPSAAVRAVQRTLREGGYHLGRPGVDGRFGPLTARAVRRLQSNQDLAVDGVVGRHTRRVLRSIDRRARAKADRARAERRAPTSTERTSSRPRSQVRPAQTATATQAPAPAPPGSTVALLVAVALSGALGGFLATLSLGRRRKARGGHAQQLQRGAVHNAAAALAAPAAAGAAQGLAAGSPVIGYITVASDTPRGQVEEKVRTAEAACRRAGWQLIEVVTDREAARSLQRPGLSYALGRISDGQARGLVVPELRRLGRSIVDLGGLMQWFRDADATLIGIDLDLDTSTPEGHQIATRLITLSAWERDRIAARTRSGLAEVRASGKPTGRPAVADRPELAARITAMREHDHMTLQAIADQLNHEGIPTLRGGTKWRPSSVQAILGYRRPATRTLRFPLPTLKDR